MARKKRIAHPLKEWLDKATDKVDPITLAAMTLGGTATMLGITPPMTSILVSFAKAPSLLGSSGSGYLPGSSLMPGYTIWAQQYMRNQDETPPQPFNPEGWGKEDVALFCSGAMEALITLELVRNKEFIQSLLGSATTLGAAAIRAAGEAAPL